MQVYCLLAVVKRELLCAGLLKRFIYGTSVLTDVNFTMLSNAWL